MFKKLEGKQVKSLKNEIEGCVISNLFTYNDYS